MPTPLQPLFAELARRSSQPVVVAHRGDSCHHPENTLAAFAAAATIGAPAIEFDVRQLRCGALVCVHDATFDRTSDARRRLGPGALAAQLDLPAVRTLDAGSWHERSAGPETVPTLAEALAVMRPHCVPMIEHKAGEPTTYAMELCRLGVATACILQSFDWEFLAAVRALAPEVPLGVLGPTARHPRLDREALREAAALGAGMVHWEVDAWTRDAVEAAGAIGLWTCGYTADDEVRWRGAATIGLGGLCTNDPLAWIPTPT